VHAGEIVALRPKIEGRRGAVDRLFDERASLQDELRALANYGRWPGVGYVRGLPLV
jgi:hypothetical protein